MDPNASETRLDSAISALETAKTNTEKAQDTYDKAKEKDKQYLMGSKAEHS